jgi:hypothetical protein
MELGLVGVAALFLGQGLAVLLLARFRERSTAFLGVVVPACAGGAFCLMAAAYLWLRFQLPPPPPGQYRCGTGAVVELALVLGGGFLQWLISGFFVAVYLFIRSRERARSS